jgi:hypothetical protein
MTDELEQMNKKRSAQYTTVFFKRPQSLPRGSGSTFVSLDNVSAGKSCGLEMDIPRRAHVYDYR